MKQKILLAIILVCISGLTRAKQSGSSTRIALVIGVQNYTSVPPLRHSLKDAKDIASTLQGKGFKVETLLDPKTKKQLKDAVTRYYNTMMQNNGAVGIIYYAGHGTQFEGENYLIPAAANLQVPGDLDDQCLKMNLVMSVLNSSNSNLNIFLLDACRTNNFTSFTRDIVKGLASVEPPKGSIVVFATQPGTVASDGTGENGLFTSKLLKYINEPNLNISEVLRKVKRDVNDESEGKQLPSVVDNSVGGDFYFNKQAQPGGTEPQVNTSTATGKKDTEQKKNPDKKIVASVPEKTLVTEKKPGTGEGIAVGSQIWSTKNLDVNKFANGEVIPEAKTAKEWKAAAEAKQPAWCFYKNDSTNAKTYGRLYNWYAVNDPRGLAPKGWHVPTQEEWNKLEEYVKQNGEVGKAMKSATNWKQGGGTDESKLSCLPGGIRYLIGEFTDQGKSGSWWCADELKPNTANSRDLVDYNNLLFKSNNFKGCGLSVRVVKD